MKRFYYNSIITLIYLYEMVIFNSAMAICHNLFGYLEISADEIEQQNVGKHIILKS